MMIYYLWAVFTVLGAGLLLISIYNEGSLRAAVILLERENIWLRDQLKKVVSEQEH